MQKKGRAHAAKHLRAAVVGAGIGGLSTACALRQRGVEVTVFEQAERLGATANLQVWQRSANRCSIMT
jgi:phytoene dehydrogenase-like protein